MALVGVGMSTIRCITHLYAAITISKSNTSALWRPCHTGELVGTAIGVGVLTIQRIVYLQLAFKASRSDVASIGRPCYSSYLICMTSIRIEKFPVHCLPDLYGRIVTRGGDILAIGGPCHGVYRSSKTVKADVGAIDYDRLSFRSVRC